MGRAVRLAWTIASSRRSTRGVETDIQAAALPGRRSNILRRRRSAKPTASGHRLKHPAERGTVAARSNVFAILLRRLGADPRP